MSDLSYMSATEALRRFRERTLSPVELMEAVIARTEAVEPMVNAFCHTFFDRAIDEARRAEDSYMGRGDPPRPLSGIPIALKEEMPLEGEPWQLGSLAHEDDIADHTGILAERVLAAGGIVHARTTTPEFSCAAFTHSRLWGVTRNPWNQEFAVGGSSGGSAAALACGTATLASGSDIGGSIRLPAAFNGVVGFKPPYGRVPEEAPWNLDVYCHEGPLARTVRDCACLENVIAGPDSRDLVCVAPRLEIPAELEGIAGMKVALVAEPGDWPIEPEIVLNARACGAALREAGAMVEEIELDIRVEELMTTVLTHFGAIFAADIMAEAEAHPELLTRYAIHMAEIAQAAVGSNGFAGGVRGESRILAALAAILVDHEVLLVPTASTTGYVAGEDYVDTKLTVAGVELPEYLYTFLTPLFNVASRCPVLNVPSGWAQNGVPTGLQIAGRPYDDVTVFRVGAALEGLRPWLDVPERRPLQPQIG